jgi:hypothetical protein
MHKFKMHSYWLVSWWYIQFPFGFKGLRYFPSIYLVGLSKTMKTLSLVSWSKSWKLDPGSPKCKHLVTSDILHKYPMAFVKSPKKVTRNGHITAVQLQTQKIQNTYTHVI